MSYSGCSINDMADAVRLWLESQRYKVPMILSPYLKRLNQATIIKKLVILFWFLNMAIWCKHVYRLELQRFLIVGAAHLPVRLDIEIKFLMSDFGHAC